MDKLKPLIVHRFWILLGFALLLPPIAWWMTTGTLLAEIDKRWKELDTSFKTDLNGSAVANADWIKNAEDQVAIRKTKNQLSLKRLWDAQTGTRVWPPNVAPLLKDCPYRGEPADPTVRERVPDIYKDDYDPAVYKVWQIVYPRDDRTDPKRPKKVDFPLVKLPRVPALKWEGLPPTFAEIWNAQEDLWLLEQLLSALERVNSSATSMNDSDIKRIDVIDIFGGKRVADNEVASAAAATGASATGEGAMPGMVMSGGPRTAATLTSQFNIAEEYVVTPVAGAPGQMGPMSMPMPMPTATPGTPGDANAGRYVKSVPAFRTRGFQISVICVQRRALEVVRELMNCVYPVEIMRVEMVSLNPGLTKGAAGGLPGMFDSPGSTSPFPGSSGPVIGGAFPMPEVGLSATGGVSDPVLDPSLGFGTPGASGTPGSPTEAISIDPAELVALTVVGEIYIYNKPDLPAPAPAADGQTPPANGATPAAPATADAAAPAATEPANGAAPAVPAVTPATETPAATTPAPAGEKTEPTKTEPAATEAPAKEPAPAASPAPATTPAPAEKP